ncbi:hypothetical protein BGX38DRAFT_433725 [Terfezia claveryi]|nr:hypothetical protein BGX38DRAFT_433725 [Terfezia claveryi]
MLPLSIFFASTPTPVSYLESLTSFTLQQGPPSVWLEPPPLQRPRKGRKERAREWRRRKTTPKTKENSIYIPSMEGNKGKKKATILWIAPQKEGKERRKKRKTSSKWSALQKYSRGWSRDYISTSTKDFASHRADPLDPKYLLPTCRKDFESLSPLSGNRCREAQGGVLLVK